MKPLTTTFLLLLFLSFQALAQSPWPEKGTKWWYYGGDPLYGPRQMILEAVGEELYQGQISQKIERTDVDFNGNATLTGAFYTYIQNDSVFFYSDVWEEYILVFDYTAAEGDTIILKNPTTRSGPDSIFTNLVYKTDSLEHCEVGYKVKSWAVEHQRGFSEYQEVLMQEYFINPFDLYTWYGFGDADKYLRCFEDGSHEIDCSAYFNYEDEPCYGRPSSLGENGLITNISFYPNPVIDQIWVNIPGEFKNLPYKITDLCGREVLGGEIDFHYQKINLHVLQPGSYYLHFPGGKIRTQKFVVLH